ncbi:MAG: cell wall hydrolase [Opitutales bacterium]|nr:cell wall hydrolase [Opitutales bacterium]
MIKSLSFFICILGSLLITAPHSLYARAHLSPYERQILAATVVLEAAGCGHEGMQAVLNVIFNRADRRIERVIAITVKPGQFSSLNSVTRQRHPNYSPILRRAMKDKHFATAYRLVLSLERGKLTDNTSGADHYYAISMRESPDWAKHMDYISRIGGHHFLRSRPGA